MAAFLNQDIQTLDLEEVSRIFQSEASIASPSNVTEDEGFMRWTARARAATSRIPAILAKFAQTCVTWRKPGNDSP